MPTEETQASDTSQPVAEPQAEPVSAPDATQPEPATIEPAQAPSEPLPSEPATAHMGGNEPIAPAPEPMTPSASIPVITPVLRNIRELAAKARAVIQSRKGKKLEKIMLALNAKGKITNDEVEKLLHVSDATATRYLSAL